MKTAARIPGSLGIKAGWPWIINQGQWRCMLRERNSSVDRAGTYLLTAAVYIRRKGSVRLQDELRELGSKLVPVASFLYMHLLCGREAETGPIRASCRSYTKTKPERQSTDYRRCSKSCQADTPSEIVHFLPVCLHPSEYHQLFQRKLSHVMMSPYRGSLHLTTSQAHRTFYTALHHFTPVIQTPDLWTVMQCISIIKPRLTG